MMRTAKHNVLVNVYVDASATAKHNVLVNVYVEKEWKGSSVEFYFSYVPQKSSNFFRLRGSNC